MEEVQYCTNKEYCTCGKDSVSKEDNTCNCKCCREETVTEQKEK